MTKTLEQKILEHIQMLADIQPGTVWTEYHWRDIMQLSKEFDEYSTNHREKKSPLQEWEGGWPR